MIILVTRTLFSFPEKTKIQQLSIIAIKSCKLKKLYKTIHTILPESTSVFPKLKEAIQMGRQKVPKSDFQSQFSMSKIISIF